MLYRWRAMCFDPKAVNAGFRTPASLHRRTLPFLRRKLSSNSSNQLSKDAQRGRVRLEKLNARLPAFLQRWTNPLINAPLSHITSFLLLHEITAILPLFGLFGLFHYSHWLPTDLFDPEFVKDCARPMERSLRKWGFLEGQVSGDDWLQDTNRDTFRILAEAATSYAIVKVTLPLRLAVSVWAAPWFARSAVIPLTKKFRPRSRQ